MIKTHGGVQDVDIVAQSLNPIVVSTDNSTTSTLAADATYTGTSEDLLGYVQVHLTLYQEPNVTPNGDANTAQGSCYAEFSDDGTNWDISIPIVVRNGLFVPQTYVVVKRYYRVRYINDGGSAAIASLGLTETADTARNQTAFRLTSILLRTGTKDLGRTLDQSVFGSDPVSLTKSAIMGKNIDGEYTEAQMSLDKEIFTTTSESDKNVHGQIARTGISSTAYDIIVDLSDTSGFLHDSTGRIDITNMKIAIDPAANSVGALKVGVITAIDGTDADISYLFQILFGKSNARILSQNIFSPSQLKFGTSGGALTFAITDDTETTASVNTGGTVNTPIGTATPAVGDIIVKYLHTSGSAWDSQMGYFYHSHASAS